jgi:hypothetical protein
MYSDFRIIMQLPNPLKIELTSGRSPQPVTTVFRCHKTNVFPHKLQNHSVGTSWNQQQHNYSERHSQHHIKSRPQQPLSGCNTMMSTTICTRMLTLCVLQSVRLASHTAPVQIPDTCAALMSREAPGSPSENSHAAQLVSRVCSACSAVRAPEVAHPVPPRNHALEVSEVQ